MSGLGGDCCMCPHFVPPTADLGNNFMLIAIGSFDITSKSQPANEPNIIAYRNRIPSKATSDKLQRQLLKARVIAERKHHLVFSVQSPPGFGLYLADLEVEIVKTCFKSA